MTIRDDLIWDAKLVNNLPLEENDIIALTAHNVTILAHLEN